MHYKDYSTEDFIQDEFFQKWVSKPNEENARYWASFLNHYPQQKIKIEEAREFLLLFKPDSSFSQPAIEQIKTDFNKRIDQYEISGLVAPTASKTLQQFKAWRFASRIAASLILILLIGYVAFQFSRESNFLTFFAFEELRTLNGKQSRIILSDGTMVWLNSNSNLKYPKNFNREKVREVFLTGEAFFEVTEDKQKPFIVRTSSAAIKVLGTAFNVKSYSNDSCIETTLVHGKVSISAQLDKRTEEITLLPNQQVRIDKATKEIKLKKSVDTDAYTSWKSGWIIFEDQSFSYIKETLERWYDVTIVMEDKNSLSCTFSGKFKDKTITEVLEVFKNTESINYRIENNTVFIEGKLCDYNNTNPESMRN